MTKSISAADKHLRLIRWIGETHFYLQEMAYREYKPIADDLCSRVATEAEVEYVLDRLVSFCGTDDVLSLFKRICRRYLYLYPEMIYFEIQLYREMFEEEEGPEDKAISPDLP